MAQTTTRDTRPLPKRRRLNPTAAYTTSQNQQPTSKPVASAICASCHRAGHVLICPRCSAATCAVCARTCTAYTMSPPSTPHLSWSPTSSPAHSPRRAALALNVANTNTDLSTPAAPATAPASTLKRKKPREEDDPDGVKDGCGRTVCRDCCFEFLQEGTTTCYDCYGR